MAGVERAEARGKERKGEGIGERRKEAPSSQVLFLPHFPPPSPPLFCACLAGFEMQRDESGIAELMVV